MKKFTLLILSTALLLFIALTPTISDNQQTNYQVMLSTAIDRTPAYATDRHVLGGAGYKMPILTHLQPGFALNHQNHRFESKANTHYIDLTAGANMDNVAPTTSNATFQLRT